MSENQLAIRKKSLYHLAKREYSTFELAQKLKTAGFELSEIEKEIQLLKQANALSDERFCQMLIRSRKNRGFGPIKIEFELNQHQIDPELIDEYLKPQSDEWHDLARLVRSQKFGTATVNNWQVKAKQMRFLQSRGFSLDQINSAMDKG